MGRQKYDMVQRGNLGLPDSVWSPLAEGRSSILFTSGQIIYMQDSEATHFYYIVRGTVKTFLTSESGGERILTVYHSGDILGEAAFFDEQPRVSSAMALTDCSIIAINRKQIEEVFRIHPELAMAMMKYLAGTVRILSAHVDDMAFLRADQRIARLLLSMGEKDGTEVYCTHEFLGHSVGVSRVTVSRILRGFEERGLVELGYRTVILRSSAGLQRLLE